MHRYMSDTCLIDFCILGLYVTINVLYVLDTKLFLYYLLFSVLYVIPSYIWLGQNCDL